MKTLTVLGCSGNIASSLLDQLAQRECPFPLFDKVRLVTRAPPPCRPGSPVQFEVRQGDYVSDGEFRASVLQHCDAIFLALPQSLPAPEMHPVAQQVIAGFVEANRGRGGTLTVVYVSSYNVDRAEQQGGGQGPLGDAHIATERFLAALAASTPALRCTVLRPTSFFSNFSAYDLPTVRRVGDAHFASPLGCGIKARVNWVAPSDIASAALRAFLQPQVADADGGAEAQCNIQGVTGGPGNTFSAQELAAMLTRVLGRPVRYQEAPMPSADYHALWLFLRSGGFDVQEERREGETTASFQAWLEQVRDLGGMSELS